MKFNIETRDGKPFIGPPAVGDVYPIRGGRGLRYGYQFIVMGIHEQQRMAYSLTINRDGEIVGVHSVGLHILEEMVPVGRVEGLEQLEFTVRGI